MRWVTNVVMRRHAILTGYIAAVVTVLLVLRVVDLVAS